MEKIKSFVIDHTKLPRGLYFSRRDAGCDTFDLRMTRPNSENVMQTGAIHTIEHIGATFLRNSAYKDRIIYFGPMGCRTGFYLITSGLDREQVLRCVRECMAYICSFEGQIPGATPAECGNFSDMDLDGAKHYCTRYLSDLGKIGADGMDYPLG